MSWLDEFLEQHKAYESPLNFWRWSALAAISAVVKDNIWVDRAGLYKSYCNIYVILYADSGLKKGPPINVARNLVTAVNNTKVISGRSSIQGILKELSSGGQSQPGGGIVKNQSSAFICASELSASLVEDKAALDILTDLYDRSYREGEYKSLLKMETFALKDPTLTLLGGINEAHAENLFSRKDVQGGFIGRSFIIHESKRNAINALIRKPEKTPDYKEITKYLKELSALKGPFVDLEGTPAGELYEHWYHDFSNKIDEQEIKDGTGTINRFGESVMKIAMLLALAEKPTLHISYEAMAMAIDYSQALVGNVRKATMSSSKVDNPLATHMKTMIMELVNCPNHAITRQRFNEKYWTMATSKDWDIIATSMVDSGYMSFNPVGNQIIYQMTEDKAMQWREHFKGKD